MATGSRLAQRGPLRGASRSGLLTIPIGTGRGGERTGMTWHLPTCCSCFLSANFLPICLCTHSLPTHPAKHPRSRSVAADISGIASACKDHSTRKGRSCHLPSVGSGKRRPRQPAHPLSPPRQLALSLSQTPGDHQQHHQPPPA